jgi:hypothetical protein
LDSTSAPLRMKKATFVPARSHEAASARAIKVFPVPGGPCSKTPLFYGKLDADLSHKCLTSHAWMTISGSPWRRDFETIKDLWVH